MYTGFVFKFAVLSVFFFHSAVSSKATISEHHIDSHVKQVAIIGMSRHFIDLVPRPFGARSRLFVSSSFTAPREILLGICFQLDKKLNMAMMMPSAIMVTDTMPHIKAVPRPVLTSTSSTCSLSVSSSSQGENLKSNSFLDAQHRICYLHLLKFS